jgi:peptidoglycan/xylan/chitin deacetylase (PgdA/CDA1 family)
MTRSPLRNIAITCLYAKAVITSEISAISQKRVQVLMFHDISPEAEKRFKALIHELSIDHTFIAYSDAMDRICSGAIERPYIAFSFDDGYESAYRAAGILNQYGIKACFFVCPSVLAESHSRTADEFCRLRLHTDPRGFLSWKQVEQLTSQGHEIGSHTQTHRQLSKLSCDGLEEEIGGSADLLRRRIGVVKHFAWPYGRFRHFSFAAAKVVARAGFVSAASGERGCHAGKSKDTLLCVRRDNIDLQWPLSHIRYFLAHNATSRCIGAGTTWPDFWVA